MAKVPSQSTTRPKDATQPVLKMATQLVSAYVSHNKVERNELTKLISDVYEHMLELSLKPVQQFSRLDQEPAVPIDESVTDRVIYSLEDGQPYKSLKRHLKAKYGMSPDDYREKWGLPSDYPMVAPAYARERSKLARKSGLGRAS